jgi:transcriptional regulator with XRE-family HTH domain
VFLVHVVNFILSARRCQKLGLSQGEIAKLLGVENRAQISAYENGKRDAPIPLLLKYARLAKVPLETVVDDQLSLPK